MDVYLQLEHDDAKLLEMVLSDILHIRDQRWHKNPIANGRLATIAADLEDAIRAAKEHESEDN